MLKKILFICSFLFLSVNAEACCWTHGEIEVNIDINNVNRSQGGAGDWNDINYIGDVVSFNSNVIGFGNDYHVAWVHTEKKKRHEMSKSTAKIAIDGWYDRRQTVSVYDAARNTWYGTEAYYKSVNNVVGFSYLGREYKCNINTLYGTLDYTKGSPVWLNLHADRENQDLSCGGDSPFMYKVIPGNWEWVNHYYGSVVIYLNPNYKYILDDWSTHYTGVYTNDANFSDYYVANVAKNSLRSHDSLVVDTANKFGFDNRIANGFISKDYNTDINQKLTNGYDVIGAAKDIVVNFKYKGEPSSCQLQAQIGYSRFGNIFQKDHFYGVWYIPNNPYGSKNLDQSPAQCLNNPGFGYQIVHDIYGDYYDPMYIKLIKFDRKAPDVPVTYNLFVNGIMNNLDDAMLSANKLQDYGPQSNKKYIQYGFLYNRSNGFVGDFYDLYGMKYFDDLIAKKKYLELYEQSVGYQCPKYGSEYIECDKKARDWFLATIFAGNAYDIGINPQDVYGHDFDSVWTSFMNYGILPNDKIILTAHSQGNLYSNILVEYLTRAKGYKADNINVIHIGVTSSNLTPLSWNSVVGSLFSTKQMLNHYVTDENDGVINAWRFFIYSVNGTRPLNANHAGGSISYSSNDGHGYLDKYLDRDSNIDFIVNSTYIMNTIDEIELSYERAGEAKGFANVFIIHDDYSIPYTTFFYDKSKRKSSKNNVIFYGNGAVAYKKEVYDEPSNNIFEVRVPLNSSYFIERFKGSKVVITQPNKSSNRYCDGQPFMIILKEDGNNLLKCDYDKNFKSYNFPLINNKYQVDLI